jgi:RNA recognition motif-containing protein
LKDVFRRFGNLIDIYVLNNKTCGYAKYAAIESAEAAVKSLHGQDVCGSRLKVMLADPQQDKNSTGGGDAGGRKRAKFET